MATRTTASGVAARVYIANGTFLNGDAARTVVIWFRSTATGIDRGILRAHTTNSNDRALSFRYDAAGASGGGTNVIKLSIDATGKTNAGYESASGVQTTALQCAIFSWASGGQEELWLNGVLDTPTYRRAAFTGVTVEASFLWMNAGSFDAANAWPGDVYELRIYNRKLTVVEVGIINTMQGQDTIRDGFVLKWHGDENYPGQAVVANSVTDRSGNGRNADSVTGTVIYAEDVLHTRRRRAA